MSEHAKRLRDFADAVDADRGNPTGLTYEMRDAADELERVSAERDELANWKQDFAPELAQREAEVKTLLDRLDLEAKIEALTRAANDYTAAITELARLGVSHWKLIETAPKDGTTLLLWGGGGPRVGFWNGKTWDDGDYFNNLDVTYWQPLPKDPEPGR